MLEQILLLWGAVSAAVEFLKSILVKSTIFNNLDSVSQSIVLQLAAFLIGIIGALAWGLNILPAADPTVGMIFTGLIAATGSAGIHVILSVLGIRVGVSAEIKAAEPRAQAAGETTRTTYSPFN